MRRLGIVNQETWAFFNEIYDDLSNHFQVSSYARRTLKLPILSERINRHLYWYDLKKFLKENDVVFFEWASELLVQVTHLPKVCGIVTRLHRYEMYQWADRVNWDAVDRIIVVSEAKKNEFRSRFPDHAEKVVVIPPSTSLERFFPQQKVFNGDIGILGSLSPRKRVYDLILTFYELNKERGDLHLHIGGGMRGAYQDYYYALQYIVEKLNIQDSVTFYGNVKNTPEWFGKIDIFVSNSYSEGLQVSPMEAMASGCYCLSHCWSGAEELLPEEYLFCTNDELKRRIVAYCELSDTEKIVQKQRMRELVETKFDLRQTIQEIRQVVEEVALASESKYGK